MQLNKLIYSLIKIITRFPNWYFESRTNKFTDRNKGCMDIVNNNYTIVSELHEIPFAPSPGSRALFYSRPLVNCELVMVYFVPHENT